MNRWERCTKQTGQELEKFFSEYLDSPPRSLLLIAGAGFDKRSAVIAQRIGRMQKAMTRALFVREERPGAPKKLRAAADANTNRMQQSIKNSSVCEIQIFAEGTTVIGGREMAKVLSAQSFDGVTDVVLDISALSTGVYFPAARMLLEYACRTDGGGFNLHIMVNQQPSTDYGIRGIACDRAAPVLGFSGRMGLDENRSMVQLWMPQLVPNRRQKFERMYDALAPDDVCPILPFPSINPRMADEMVADYRETLDAWSVDLSGFVYAAENDPLDLYRTILRLVDTRARVFASSGGSAVTLSPGGTKLLSVGALMAAVERDLSVVLVESIGYQIVSPECNIDRPGEAQLVHLWLHRGGRTDFHEGPLATADDVAKGPS